MKAVVSLCIDISCTIDLCISIGLELVIQMVTIFGWKDQNIGPALIMIVSKSISKSYIRTYHYDCFLPFTGNDKEPTGESNTHVCICMHKPSELRTQ